MGKLTYKDKINIYKERKTGISAIALSKKYDIGRDKVYYLEKLIDRHGYSILDVKKKVYSNYDKERIINRVLINGESINSVSIDEGLLSNGMLARWITEYKENYYNIIKR